MGARAYRGSKREIPGCREFYKVFQVVISDVKIIYKLVCFWTCFCYYFCDGVASFMLNNICTSVVE